MEITCPNCKVVYSVEHSLIFNDVKKKERSFKCSSCDHLFMVSNPAFVKEDADLLDKLESTPLNFSKETVPAPGVMPKPSAPAIPHKNTYHADSTYITPAPKNFISRNHLDWWLLGIAFSCVAAFIYSEREYIFERDDNPLVEWLKSEAPGSEFFEDFGIETVEYRQEPSSFSPTAITQETYQGAYELKVFGQIVNNSSQRKALPALRIDVYGPSSDGQEILLLSWQYMVPQKFLEPGERFVFQTFAPTQHELVISQTRVSFLENQ